MNLLLTLVVTLVAVYWLSQFVTNSVPYRIALVLMAALLFVGASGPHEAPFAFFGLFVLIVGMAWLHEFRYLMELNDDVFPGRNDKLIWALLMIILPPVGAVAFWSFRRAHWPQAKPTVGHVSAELS